MDEFEDLIEQYKILHKQKNPSHNGDWFPGKSIFPHITTISKLIKEHSAETLLDYGCGLGHQYSKYKVHNKWGGILPRCYDPAVEEFSKIPEGVFSGVISTDVLEHIPEEYIEQVISTMFEKANRFVFLSIALFPANEILPDGRNAHVTLKSEKWWKEKINKCNKNNINCVVSWRYSGKKYKEENVKNGLFFK